MTIYEFLIQIVPSRLWGDIMLLRFMILISFLGSLLSAFHCATMKETPVRQKEYSKLYKKKIIYVYLKDRQIYALKDFVITETRIEGIIYNRETTAERRIVIDRKEVEFITIKKLRYQAHPVFTGFLIASVTVITVAVLTND